MLNMSGVPLGAAGVASPQAVGEAGPRESPLQEVGRPSKTSTEARKRPRYGVACIAAGILVMLLGSSFVASYASGPSGGLAGTLERISVWPRARSEAQPCTEPGGQHPPNATESCGSASIGSLRGRDGCCEVGQEVETMENLRPGIALDSGSTMSPTPPPEGREADFISMLNFSMRRTEVGTWSVVQPPWLAEALTPTLTPASAPARLDWHSVCKGTAADHSTTHPTEPVDGGVRIRQGSHFSGEPHELYRQMARGLCVVLLQHPSTTLPSGEAMPAETIRFPHNDWWAPVDPWDSWATTRAVWAEYLKSQSLPGRMVLTEPLTRRSHASIVVLRNPLLWPEGFAFSRAATLGGGGCREWSYFQKEGDFIAGLGPPAQAKPEGQPITVKGLKQERIPHINGTVLHVNMLWQSGHYHYMSELLPRIWISRALLLKDTSIVITTGSAISGTLREAMDLFGVSPSRLRIMMSPFTSDWAVVPSGSGCTTTSPALQELSTMGDYILSSALQKEAQNTNAPYATVVKSLIDGMVQSKSSPLPQPSVLSRGSPPPREAMPSMQHVWNISEHTMHDYNRSYLRIPEQLRVMLPDDLLPAGPVPGRVIPRDASRTAAVRSFDAAVTALPRPLVLVIHRTAKRLLGNEGEVLEWIHDVLPDADVLLYKSLPLGQQAMAFRMAALIVAPHGAGLINVIFCKADTPVVEVHTGQSEKEPNLSPWPAVYSQLTRGMGSAYFVLMAPGTSSTMHVSEGPFKDMVRRAWALSWWHSAL